MTAPARECQPEAATPYQHVCSDVDCCYQGQPSFRGCGCYKTREQMMAARIEDLTKGVQCIIENWHCGDIKPEDIAQLRALFDSDSALSLEDRS